MLVKGALQTVKETDIHENRNRSKYFSRWLTDRQSTANIHETKLTVVGELEGILLL